MSMYRRLGFAKFAKALLNRAQTLSRGWASQSLRRPLVIYLPSQYYSCSMYRRLGFAKFAKGTGAAVPVQYYRPIVDPLVSL